MALHVQGYPIGPGAGLPFGSYTPALSASTPGTMVAGATVGHFYQIGKLVFFSATGTITTVGTSTGYNTLSLPPGLPSVGTIRYQCSARNLTNGKVLTGSIEPGTSLVILVNVDNTFAGADATAMSVSGFYETA